jgi:hypothetical protein
MRLQVQMVALALISAQINAAPVASELQNFNKPT